VTGPSGSGEHVGEAVLYAADKELVGVAGPFLRAGLAAGDAVLLVCTDRRNALLTEAVEHDPRLTVLPVPQVWRRPTEAMADYQSLIEEQAAVGRRLWVVADADHGSGPVEWSEWARFEAASHHASAPYPVRSLCLVDRREAPAQVVAAVRRVHPLLWTDGVRARSPDHAEPAENICRDAYVRSDPMEAASPTLQVGGVTGAADLSRVRHALGAELARSSRTRSATAGHLWPCGSGRHRGGCSAR
jgi:hypothetical protein